MFCDDSSSILSCSSAASDCVGLGEMRSFVRGVMDSFSLSLHCEEGRIRLEGPSLVKRWCYFMDGRYLRLEHMLEMGKKKTKKETKKEKEETRLTFPTPDDVSDVSSSLAAGKEDTLDSLALFFLCSQFGKRVRFCGKKYDLSSSFSSVTDSFPSEWTCFCAGREEAVCIEEDEGEESSDDACLEVAELIEDTIGEIETQILSDSKRNFLPLPPPQQQLVLSSQPQQVVPQVQPQQQQVVPQVQQQPQQQLVVPPPSQTYVMQDPDKSMEKAVAMKSILSNFHKELKRILTV